MCPAAARLNDPIAHTSILGNLAKMGGSLVAGALIGAALSVAAVAAVGVIVGTGGLGLGAVLAIGFAVSVAMEATGVNEFIDRQVNRLVDTFIPPSIEGSIATGSWDVRINSRLAARAAAPGMQDTVLCARHASGAPPMIAQGSDNVFINDHPATRKGDQTTCGGTIAEGSGNVFIGGGTVTVREIEDERPWWIRALGMALGVALALCGRGRMNVSALKAALPCLLMNMGASMAGTMVGHQIRTTIGNPVNVITGGKVMRDAPDAVLPGPMPLEWTRFYSSHDGRDGSLFGPGWSVPYEVELALERDGAGALAALTYRDEQGRGMRFPAVQPGESHFSSAEGYYLICTQAGQYVVESVDGIYRDFGMPTEGYSGILKLQRLEDRNGNWHALRYEDGRLRTINDGCGRALDLLYDGLHANRVAALRLSKGAENEATGLLAEYRYTAQGELAEVVDRTGRAVRCFAYRDGLMVEHAVPGGLHCYYAWQGTGADARVVRHWTDDGEAYDLRYDLRACRTLVTDQLDRQQQWEWNADCQPTAYIDAEGHVWRYAWDPNRQLVELLDPAGAVTRLEYDPLGRIKQITNALGQIEKTEWHDRFDLPTAEIDAAGNRWQYDYDERGNLIVVTDPEGCPTEHAYDTRGLPHTIRDARGGYKHMRWNLRAQLLEYTDCSDKSTYYAYDEHSLLASVTDAMGNATVYRNDAAGRVTAIVDPEGGVQQLRYDALGRLSAVIDPAEHRTSYERNARGLPTRRINAMGRSVEFVYDRAQRLVKLINENGEAYGFGYDRNDNLVEETGLDGTVKRIEHDARGLPVKVIDAAGEPDAITLHMERDALGRLSVKHARGRSTLYRYDQIGQLLHAEVFSDDGRRRVVHDKLLFTYSRRGELLSETSHLGMLAHRYDELGNRCATTLPDGRTINRLHYGSGHLHQINIDGDVISDFERDDLHREILRTHGALTTRFGYDKLGRKTWQDTTARDTHEPVLRKEWEYDRAGELVKKIHSRNGQTRYHYDPLGRIVSTVGPAGNELFHWDAAANLVDTTQVGGYVKYNRVTVFEDKRYEYDIHGRMETKRIGRHTEQRFYYDGEHRLREVETVRNGVKQAVYFDYDALGRRIRKWDAFGETLFLWDGLQMIQEQRGGNVATYLYEPGTYVPLARTDLNWATKLLPSSPSNNDTVFKKKHAILHFQNDIMGVPTELHAACRKVAWNAEPSNASIYYSSDIKDIPTEPRSISEKLVWSAELTTWGATASETWHLTPAPSAQTPEPLPQNLRFQGQYLDRETGLHYNTFRYYDPDIGHFISPDPIGLTGGSNFYQYAPNTSSWIDPWGWRCGPGTATGNGKEVRQGRWLRGTHGNAGVFPQSIANKLRGKSFRDFDHFREEFWREVAKDPDLSSQFSKSNITRMSSGRAPKVSVTQSVGKNTSYALHHAQPIQHGGGVYDMDNLRIVTPRYHAEILDPTYHY
jgi:RHS repeat-associated protein